MRSSPSKHSGSRCRSGSGRIDKERGPRPSEPVGATPERTASPALTQPTLQLTVPASPVSQSRAASPQLFSHTPSFGPRRHRGQMRSLRPPSRMSVSTAIVRFLLFPLIDCPAGGPIWGSEPWLRKGRGTRCRTGPAAGPVGRRGVLGNTGLETATQEGIVVDHAVLEQDNDVRLLYLPGRHVPSRLVGQGHSGDDHGQAPQRTDRQDPPGLPRAPDQVQATWPEVSHLDERHDDVDLGLPSDAPRPTRELPATTPSGRSGGWPPRQGGSEQLSAATSAKRMVHRAVLPAGADPCVYPAPPVEPDCAPWSGKPRFAGEHHGPHRRLVPRPGRGLVRMVATDHSSRTFDAPMTSGV
jgi:hypothetical protein